MPSLPLVSRRGRTPAVLLHLRLCRRKILGQGSATPVGALETWLGTAQRRRARAKVVEIVGSGSRSARTSVVQTQETRISSPSTSSSAMDCLLSSGSESESDGEVRRIQVSDNGSQSQCVVVEIQGVPASGLVDTGSNITIIGGQLFRHVAATARLHKKNTLNHLL